MKVSVVLPYYMASAELELTMTALGRQTYPDDLMEVVVADDGSDPPCSALGLPQRISSKVVWQEDRGFRLAAVRNLGGQQATGDIILFLDCDVIPSSCLVEAHARWHHLLDYAVTVGARRYIDPSGISADDIVRSGGIEHLDMAHRLHGDGDSPWIQRIFADTADLAREAPTMFRAVTGGNIALRRGFFEAVGGFCERFTRWGGEDTEFGWRAYSAGALLVPEHEAIGWHQGKGGWPSGPEIQAREDNTPLISNLIPSRPYRVSPPGRLYEVPKAVVDIEVETETRQDVQAAVESFLAGWFTDLAVRITLPDLYPDRAWLADEFAADCRVTLVSREKAASPWPAAFWVRAPANARVPTNLLQQIVDVFEGRAATAAQFDDIPGIISVSLSTTTGPTCQVHAARTRAIGRGARLAPDDSWAAAARLFGSHSLPEVGPLPARGVARFDAVERAARAFTLPRPVVGSLLRAATVPRRVKQRTRRLLRAR